MTKNTDPDLDLLDELGIRVVANALDLSVEAVRRWRNRGVIPDQRRDELRRLVANQDNVVRNQEPPGSEPVDAEVPNPPGRLGTSLPMVIPQDPAPVGIDLDRIQGADAIIQVEAMIAERAARQAAAAAQRATRRIPDMTPKPIVPWYWARLFGLFLLEFPVLTMAFVPVAEVSPIVAAGSAAALALFLVLGAHALGAPLRSLSDRLPSVWRHGIAVALMAIFLGAVVWIILELRIEGLARDELGSAPVGSVFGAEPPPTPQRAFVTVIAVAAALVTLGTLLFGIVWSYQRHGPEADLARAEAAYRDRLRRLARTRARIAGRKGRIMSSFLVALIAIGAISKTPRAADCPGTTVVALLDVTTAYDDIDRAAIIPAIEAMAASLEGDQRLMVRTVSDSAANSSLLFDACVPAEHRFEWSISGIWTWLTANPATVTANRRTFHADLRDALLPVLQGHVDTERTALLETIIQVSETTRRMAGLWLFSDLLESAQIVPSALLEGRQSILIDAISTLPSLDGIVVHVAGFGRFHDPDRRSLTTSECQALLDAWRLLVIEAGGQFRGLPLGRIIRRRVAYLESLSNRTEIPRAGHLPSPERRKSSQGTPDLGHAMTA